VVLESVLYVLGFTHPLSNDDETICCSEAARIAFQRRRLDTLQAEDDEVLKSNFKLATRIIWSCVNADQSPQRRHLGQRSISGEAGLTTELKI
jgi:hypothetical protein